ncbi:MAG: hypothetical protein DRP71_00815 [Verrucomicrobia bacterium]|nr:MAG: hypothetical protein DRP71_00815 [Verrucomicrobiota bacterium]
MLAVRYMNKTRTHLPQRISEKEDRPLKPRILTTSAGSNPVSDCGSWMLKRSIANRKLEALALGRDKFLGH